MASEAALAWSLIGTSTRRDGGSNSLMGPTTSSGPATSKCSMRMKGASARVCCCRQGGRWNRKVDPRAPPREICRQRCTPMRTSHPDTWLLVAQTLCCESQLHALTRCPSSHPLPGQEPRGPTASTRRDGDRILRMIVWQMVHLHCGTWTTWRSLPQAEPRGGFYRHRGRSSGTSSSQQRPAARQPCSSNNRFAAVRARRRRQRPRQWIAPRDLGTHGALCRWRSTSACGPLVSWWLKN